jgi:hypothetical protein
MIAIVVALVAVAPAAASADDVSAAADAFARAQKLSLEGKPGEAADLYELADELAPSPAALRNAARARYAAGHIAMAATDAAELLRRYPDDAVSRKIAEMILDEVRPKVARIDVACEGSCSVLIDGKAASRKKGDRHTLFAKAGDHQLTAVFEDGQKKSEKTSVAAGAAASLQFDAPPPIVVAPPPTDDAEPVAARKGLPRGWFIAGAIITVGLGGAAVYEGMATLDDRDQIKELVAAGDRDAAEAKYDDARGRQRLTNILIGATAAAGVATITAAIFTRWSNDPASRERNLAITPAAGGATLTYGGSF